MIGRIHKPYPPSWYASHRTWADNLTKEQMSAFGRMSGPPRGKRKVVVKKSTRGPAKHGTRSKYNGGCRCLECKEANRLHGVEQRNKKLNI
jgi:hypothetical protein